MDNSVVLDEHSVVNPDGLRYTDEFVRHKILDFVGDMAMMGVPLQGHFTIHCSGHALNNEFLRELKDNASLSLEELTDQVKAKDHRAPKLPAQIPALQPDAA